MMPSLPPAFAGSGKAIGAHVKGEAPVHARVIKYSVKEG